MYKCLECSHIFDEGEQVIYRERHGFIDGLYEHFTGCPLCKSAYERTVSCAECGGEFLSDELFEGGVCKDCLINSIDLQNGMLYLVQNSLDLDFYFRHWQSSPIKYASHRLMEIVKNAYLLHAKIDPEAAKKTLSAYIAEDESGLSNYAEWLVWKEGGHEASAV